MMLSLVGLPDDAVSSILDQLPPHTKPWYRWLSKSCAQHLRNHKSLSARQPDLPLWLLKQHFRDISSGAQDPSGSQTHTQHLVKIQQAQLLSARAAAGDLAGVQWLRSQGCAWTSHCCIAAAEAGHVNTLYWLLSQSPACPIDTGLCALAAASAGQLPVLQFLNAELLLRPFDMAACAEAAAAAGMQSVLEWLVLQDGGLATAAAMADQAAAEAARQQVQVIMAFARSRLPLGVYVGA